MRRKNKKCMKTRSRFRICENLELNGSNCILGWSIEVAKCFVSGVALVTSLSCRMPYLVLFLVDVPILF